MKPIPARLRETTFTRSTALASGVTPRMLDGGRFVRVHPGVWRTRDFEMTEADWVCAARQALPDRAHLTGISRIQQLGLDFGPRRPLRFVIEGDHHLAIDQIFLHRTVRLPATDDVGVTVPAAFIAYAARARVIDAIKVGDWLLRHEHLDSDGVRTLALADPWRDGADEALWILDHLDGAARSLKESETRAILEFAGLPPAEVNVVLDTGADAAAIGDLLYRQWGLLVEYEGGHHQTEREQYCSDIDRYALLRSSGLRYVQVTKEKLARPKILVGEVFRALIAGGYDGPPPEFGERWRLLFSRVSTAVGPPRGRRRAAARRR